MKIIIATALILLPFLSLSQSVVSYHQSPNGGQAAYAYEIHEKFRPELRLYANTLMEDLLVKLMFNYDWVQKDNYEFYSGLSFLAAVGTGGATFGLPIGLNVYPFEKKKFGFLMEFAPSFPLDASGGAYFTGSWGIRYRFNRN